MEMKTLSELASEGFVLLDTCTLSSPFDHDGSGYGDGTSIRMESDSLDFFKREVLRHPGRIFVTPEILEEFITGGKINLCKKHRFASSLRSTGGVVNFEDEESSAFEILRIRYVNYRIAYGLSEPDTAHAIAGIVMAKYRGSTVVVSRDRYLIKFLADVAPRIGITNEVLRAFYRRHFDSFDRAHF